MKIKAITVEGDAGKSATLTREGETLVIASVHFLTERISTDPNADVDVLAIARVLQYNLDGFRGTKSDIWSYRDLITSLMD